MADHFKAQAWGTATGPRGSRGNPATRPGGWKHRGRRRGRGPGQPGASEDLEPDAADPATPVAGETEPTGIAAEASEGSEPMRIEESYDVAAPELDWRVAHLGIGREA